MSLAISGDELSGLLRVDEVSFCLDEVGPFDEVGVGLAGVVIRSGPCGWCRTCSGYGESLTVRRGGPCRCETAGELVNPVWGGRLRGCP